LKKLTVEEIEVMVSTLLYATEDEVEDVKADPNASVFQKIVCAILEKTKETGSMGHLDLLLNRVVGKVKEKFDVEIVKPSILERRDGSQIVFHINSQKKDETNG
jgi:hypothetical protein